MGVQTNFGNNVTYTSANSIYLTFPFPCRVSINLFSFIKQVCTLLIGEIEQQSGAAEACWAHNPEVRGSKPRSAKVFLFFNFTKFPHGNSQFEFT